MTSQLSPRSSTATKLYPPLDFLPVGKVTWAKFADHPPDFILRARTRTRGRKRAGMLYETRVHDYLAEATQFYLPGPWIVFTEEGSARKRWSQPDALILDFVRGKCTIVEVKLKHTDRAWWQVRRQYEPLLRALFYRGWEFAAVEIAQWVDPHLPFPEKIQWVSHPAEVPAGAFGVFQFSGRR